MKQTQNSVAQHEQESTSEAPAIPFILMPGDKIIGCSGLWAASDRTLEELGRCHACDRPTFRVVTITSAEKLERRAALCGQHFVLAARRFPELEQDRNSGAA